MSMDPFIQEFLALYEPGGVAYGLLEGAKSTLLSGKGPKDEHDLGLNRGVIHGLEALRFQVAELHKIHQTRLREPSEVDGEEKPSPRIQPMRRLI